eukprot:EG_transcript_1642
MRVSVYMIYVTACLLAIGAAALSGVILLDTFTGQQAHSEAAQLIAGEGQVRAMQNIILNRMTRMETITEEHSRQLLVFIDSLPTNSLLPANVIQALNQTIFTTWAPSVRANNSLNGYGLTFMYVNETTGDHFDRTFWVYWDLMTTGRFDYLYAYTNLTDGLTHAYRTVWRNFSKLHLAEDMYNFDTNALEANIYKNNNFFDFAQPWASADGNSYWYFTHMRAFQVNGVYMNVQSWDVGLSWLGLMQSGLTPEANVAAFDSQGYVMAATNADELQRLSQCRGWLNGGEVAAACISTPASDHPVAEIRNLYNALHTSVWDDLSAAPIPLQQSELRLSGKRYMAIVATLFSRDHFRTTIVWYQPWAVLQANAVGLTALICLLTMLSTFLLTLLGVFGVLRPLMALGNAMRAVAHSLKDGGGENETVLEPRKPNVFREVDEIGKDFETIVVDFLGFSNTNARDNKHAPKDPDEPFAVVFTDIQSSTGLWGRDPAEMSRCVQAHHELIREQIRQHRLYEVKTVGDSFVVTTTSAQGALLFALDVQTALFEFDWQWDGADDFYRETTLAFLKPTAADDDYDTLWNGLRVRIGIHYGMGDVTYDEVSKGYDYYGTVVNTTARIEALAHGGQVVVTEDLLAALDSPLDPALAIATPLGTFPLRGVTDPPALVELKPVPLQARTFPPLRVDRANADTATAQAGDSPHPRKRPSHLPDFKLAGALEADPYASMPDTKGARRTSAQSALSGTADRRPLGQAAEDFARGHAMVRSGAFPLEAVAQQLLVLQRVVEDLLRPLAPPQFAAVTKALAKAWGVPAPKAKADFGSSGLRLMQRMSETTPVLTYMGQPPALDAPLLVPDSPRMEDDVLEVEAI